MAWRSTAIQDERAVEGISTRLRFASRRGQSAMVEPLR